MILLEGLIRCRNGLQFLRHQLQRLPGNRRVQLPIADIRVHAISDAPRTRHHAVRQRRWDRHARWPRQQRQFGRHARAHRRFFQQHQLAGCGHEQHDIGIRRRIAQRCIHDAFGVSGNMGMPGTSSIFR